MRLANRPVAEERDAPAAVLRLDRCRVRYARRVDRCHQRLGGRCGGCGACGACAPSRCDGQRCDESQGADGSCDSKQCATFHRFHALSKDWRSMPAQPSCGVERRPSAPGRDTTSVTTDRMIDAVDPSVSVRKPRRSADQERDDHAGCGQLRPGGNTAFLVPPLDTMRRIELAPAGSRQRQHVLEIGRRARGAAQRGRVEAGRGASARTASNTSPEAVSKRVRRDVVMGYGVLGTVQGRARARSRARASPASAPAAAPAATCMRDDHSAV